MKLKVQISVGQSKILSSMLSSSHLEDDAAVSKLLVGLPLNPEGKVPRPVGGEPLVTDLVGAQPVVAGDVPLQQTPNHLHLLLGVDLSHVTPLLQAPVLGLIEAGRLLAQEIQIGATSGFKPASSPEKD